MNPAIFFRTLTAALFFALSAHGAVHYVDPNSSAHIPPYSSWTTAALDIQDAVDVASPGDQVLVIDGTYQTGNRVSPDGATNRVVVTNAITLQSVNGASVTTVDGGNTNRCVYLSGGAALIGFTTIKGNTTNGYAGGVYCASTNAQVQNCQIIFNAAKYGGGIYSGTVTNCTISSNYVVFAGSGGGAYNSTLLNCTINGNYTLVNGGSGAGAVGGFLANCTINNNTCNGSGATVGAGVSGSYVTNCMLSGNRVTGAGSDGGGANASTLINCTLSNNRCDFAGGGAYNSTLTNCTLVSNRSSYGGGGVSGGTLVNCVLRNNTSSGGYGGGVYWTTTLINCTLVGNSAGYGGGGYSCTFNNCIIYYNSALNGPDTYGATYSYCCTPVGGGVGNVTTAPIFANQAGGDFHLQPGSGGIDVGTNSYAWSLTDIEGNLRIANGTVDMGAYEYQQPNPATVTIEANYTNVVVGIPVNFKGVFSRGTTDSWDFGDGTVISNAVFVTHSWATPGDYSVTLTIYDSSNPSGASGVYVIHVIPPPISYVDPASLNPVPPYSSWQTAATNVQDAVDAVVFGAHILVTNGTYQIGGRTVYGLLTNRLVINKPVLVQSVNGPAVTTIQGNPTIGDTAVRCAYLTNSATLSGFTLLNGATRASGDANKEQSGGGVWCESTNAFVLNCVVISNKANVYAGGVRGGSLTNCSLIANAASGSGGGAFSNVMSGCLLSNNTAIIGYGPISGGGASGCTLVSCTLVSNITDTPNFHPASGGGAVNSTLINCSLLGNAGKDGGGASSSTLRNCTLAGNSAGTGGGASVCTLSGCLVISNSAAGGVGGGCSDSIGTNCIISQNSSGYQGGGACGGAFYNSLITGNSAPGSAGGGTAANPSGTGTTLWNCTVVGNWAYYAGGGVDSCPVWNSIVTSNSTTNSPDSPNWHGGTLNYCCTTPLPDTGSGNIAAAPFFVNQAAGNFQLQSNSPCINAGTNGYVIPGADLAGNSRIISGTVDLGPYENQSPALAALFAWFQTNNISTHASSLYADLDHDGMNNLQEWIAGTDLTNANSNFRVQSLSLSNSPARAKLIWTSVTNRAYFIERSTSLNISAFSLLKSNLAGLLNTTSFTDSNPPATGPAFYRVGIQQ